MDVVRCADQHPGADAAATWSPVISSQLQVPPREVSIQARVSATAAHWEQCASNTVLFPVRLRTSTAIDADAQQYPAHAVSMDLAMHSAYFCRAFSSDTQATFKDVRELDSMVLGLDVPQQLLHNVVRSLYAGAIELSPANVEQVLMVAQYLGMECALQACSEYLLEDCLEALKEKDKKRKEQQNGQQQQQQQQLARQEGSQAEPATAAGLLAQLAQLVVSYADWMAPALLLALAESLESTCPTLSIILDSILDTKQAAELIRLKKARGYACETQVLQLIKALPSKRMALLALVEFGRMHQEELRAVQRYAGQMLGLLPVAAAVTGHKEPQSQAEAEAASSEQQEQQEGSSRQATSNRFLPCGSDGFWQVVYNSSSALALDGTCAPLEGACVAVITAAHIKRVSWEGDTEVLAKLQLDSQEYTLKLVQGESSTGQKAVSLSLVPPGSQKLRTAERSVVFQLFALHQMPGDAAGTDGGTSLVEVLPPMMPEKETGVNESMGDADGVGRWLGIPAMKLPAPAGAQIAVGVRVKHVSLEAQ